LLNKKRIFLIIFSLFFFLISFNSISYANYSTNFNSSNIQLISPSINNLEGDNFFIIEGFSIYNKVWACARTPDNKLVIYGIDVIDGKFKKVLPLRFGPGTYTIWVSDNQNYFDGSIRFEIINNSTKDIRYSSPSYFIDSDNQFIIDLISQIIIPEMNDMEKILIIHNWITNNISYDYNKYLYGSIQTSTASQTLLNKKGVCQDYSLLMAAMARASGLEARVVYGQGLQNNIWQSHGWNEIKVNDQWITIDSTWDAGYIQNGLFIFSPSMKYFNANNDFFSLTHYSLSYMNY